MRHALLGEWTKLRTIRSNLWIALAIAGLLAAGGTVIILSTGTPGCEGDRQGCPSHDTTALMLSGVHFAQLAVVALAAAVVCSEFHPRVLRTTLAMNPRRTTVFAAKTLAVAASVLGTAALGGVIAVLLGPTALASRGLTAQVGYRQLALSADALQRATAGTVVYLVLVALFSVGVSAVVRHSGAAIGAVVTALYGPYLAALLIPMPPHALHMLQAASPMTAGLAVQTTIAGAGTAALRPWAGLAVMAAYALGALVLGGAAFTTRDA